jgi:hypothetical protein
VVAINRIAVANVADAFVFNPCVFHD